MKLFHRGSSRPQIAAPNGQAVPGVGHLSSSSVESLTQQIGYDLLAKARAAPASGLFSDALMRWALPDPALRTQLFRFIDVFPVLKTPQAIHQHLVEYLGQPGVELPPTLSVALSAGGMVKGAFASAVAGQISATARTFIAGETPQAALPVLQRLWENGSAFSVDLLGEACLSEEEARVYQQRYLELMSLLPPQVATWPAQPTLETNHLGPIPRTNVSIKISSLYAHTRPVAFEQSLDGLVEALTPILTAAAKANVLINFDMEQHAFKDLTLALFMRCCQRFDFPAGIAIQTYLRSIDEDVGTLIRFAHQSGRQFIVRLIKGAYWDYETIHAQEEGWPVPVWSTKAQTDAAFERAAALLVEQIPRDRWQAGIHLAVGSHNLRSIAHTLALVRQAHLPEAALEVQMLFGMADQLKAAVIASGLRLRQYVPTGQLIPGMAYLVRRLLENTSNESWLRHASLNEASVDALLAPPQPEPEAVPAIPRGFANEPHHDFADARQREAFAQAVAATALPDAPADVTLEQASAALAAAVDAFPAWRDAPDRAAILVRAADDLHAQRDALAAIMVKETSKTWAEADADVCEAIDFCRYYAHLAPSLLTEQPLPGFGGEINHLVHLPRGVALVIAPWNFPLAILTGMTAAALVTGNPVLMKPAEQSVRLAEALCRILYQAGVPREVLHFVPGPGETVGAALVRDPRIAIIAFTGSKAVGLDILQAAYAPSPEPTPEHSALKHVIVEMGGKNAIIVDASADLDEAVLGVRQSAFSYAGQKCSACSRCIVLDDIYDTFLHRLIESTKTLCVGDPADPATDVPPVISDEAAAKIWHAIDVGPSQASLIYPASEDQRSEIRNRLVPPHLFTNVSPASPLANDEIFGPVLAIFRVPTFEAALALANASAYKLTGGVYSRTPSHLALARRAFHVGNLYLNRPITGALVARQPFGGFGLSGLGSKAGGPHYLLHFLNPKTITENTLRHGFAPTTPSSAASPAPTTGE